jgi:hypothetical protein
VTVCADHTTQCTQRLPKCTHVPGAISPPAAPPVLHVQHAARLAALLQALKQAAAVALGSSLLADDGGWQLLVVAHLFRVRVRVRVRVRCRAVTRPCYSSTVTYQITWHLAGSHHVALGRITSRGTWQDRITWQSSSSTLQHSHRQHLALTGTEPQPSRSTRSQHRACSPAATS